MAESRHGVAPLHSRSSVTDYLEVVFRISAKQALKLLFFLNFFENFVSNILKKRGHFLQFG
jgi:hypothetical protein